MKTLIAVIILWTVGFLGASFLLFRRSWVLFLMCLVSSCSLKTGLYNLDHYNQSLGIREEPLSYWEMELSTRRLIKDHVDIVFGVGYNAGFDEGRLESPGPEENYSRWPKTKSAFWDVHLGTRVFPLGVNDRKIIPYVGGGVGYFDYLANTYSLKFESEYGYGGYWSGYRPKSHYSSVASGYFTYLSTGFYVRLSEAVLWQTEFRYDDDKSDNVYDMSGSKLTVGLGFLCD